MFAKLLKFEFRSVRKALMPVSIAVLLSSALGYFLILFMKNSPAVDRGAFFVWPFAMLIISIFLLFLVYLIGSSIYLYIHFYKTKFTDQGYLTFTLPATTHQILLSSIINFIIWSIIIFLVVIFSIFMLAAPSYSTIQDAFSLLSGFISLDSFVTPLSAFAFILQTISNLCYSIILPFLSLTVGSLIAKKHKVLTSFGIGYGISIGYNMLTSYLSMILTSDSSIDEAFQQYNYYIITVSIVTILLCVSGYFVMHHIVKKKLNI